MSEQSDSQMETMPSIGKGVNGKESRNLDLLLDVMLQVVVELGRTRMPLRQALDLQLGSVVELDRLAGNKVDIYINEHLIAHGEVITADNKIGIRITELLTNRNGDGR